MLTANEFKWTADDRGEWLCIRLPLQQIRDTLSGLKPQKKYNIEIKEFRKKRSLDANAYAWVLIGKLAAKLHSTPIEIYRTFIPDVGDNCEIVPIRAKAVEAFSKVWCTGHLGRIAEDLGECRNTPGYHNVRVYYGSSDYDTLQMSRLIELIVAECKAQNIETLTPDELNRMVSLWQ